MASSALASPDRYPYRVTTTVGMVHDIVVNVAGEKAEVVALMRPGVDPHLYKPTRDDVAHLMRADIVFYSGLKLEGRLADTLEKLAARKPVHAVTRLIAPGFLLSPDGFEGHPDPHVWMDVTAWIDATRAVADALAEFDPANADQYRRNADDYLNRLRALDEYARRSIESIPQGARVLITSHDAFNYFGRAYGLTVMGVQGLSTESEAGLRRINQLVDFLVENDVRAVFVESSVPTKNIEALIEGARSRGHVVRIGGELFSDAMGDLGTYEGTYIGMIDHNVTLVTRGLGGKAPERGMNDKLSTREHP
jgi:manganese/zinc/iron transport system substrate-binding protein